MRFKNREDAGKKLAAELSSLKTLNPVVLAIPRGGVVVGSVVAKALSAKLDVVVPRKLGAPYNPELAIGAVMHDGTYYLNNDIVAVLNVSENYIKKEIEAQRLETERRLQLYRKSRDYDLRDKNIVLVDDGIATGATVLAVINWLKNQQPKKIVVAVPVLPAETLELLKKEVDEVIYILAPYEFEAVGEFYEDFSQVEDEEVIKIMKQYR
ncbi:MAG: phosphoribosyltransferase family protein [Methanocellales archaeon]